MPFCEPGLLLHLRLKISDRLLHHSGGIEHRRQLHLARAEEFAHRPHSIQQNRVDHLERRIFLQRVFEQIFQRLAMLSVAHRLFAVDDGELQLVFDR